jgi:superfamily II DNA or RNA helicase
MTNGFRYYQKDADNAIYEELHTRGQAKCIVKMFCGTGKSLLMRHCKIIRDKNLVCFVFPSLSLIEQFNRDYLSDFQNKISISSESDSTTNTATIKKFLSSKKQKKIVCVTFQSFDVLLAVLTQLDKKIDVCIFDEAHHAVGETYQQLIFGNDVCLKQVFMTATPKNANGITMYDRFNVDAGMCGRLVYDYSYLDGLMGEYLNPFEIRVDLYSENVNRSIYESIARAVLVSGNNRVLTFHSDVNTDRETSVNNFVDLSLFRESFDKVVNDEFGEKAGHYRSVEIVGLSSDISMVERKAILARLDTLPCDEILVIASCETIGEGIDTKNANMCVFVDPKQSFVKIIQNIGRVVRRQATGSTILIPCWVDREKYLECGDDAEKCDAVIREDMQSTGGNFNGILNVMSALKQEDEDIYDVCLHYPDAFSYEEIEAHLGGQGYKILESVGDGELFENLEYLVKGEDCDEDLDADDYEDMDEDELILAVGENHDLRVEIYSTLLDEPVEVVNSEGESTIRLYRSVNEDTDEVIYSPIVSNSNEKKDNVRVKGPCKKNRPSFSVHTNPDVQVLWKIKDLTGKLGSCVIDCEVVKYDPMVRAREIVERGIERENNGGKRIPRFICNKKRITDILIQQHKDAQNICQWKQSLKGQSNARCSNTVKEYLDKNFIGWREEYDEKAIKIAQLIVQRGIYREENGWKRIPRLIRKPKNINEIQECKDAEKLFRWRNSLNGKKNLRCSNEIKKYLDENLAGWRDDLDEEAMKFAKAIIERGIIREQNGGRKIPIGTREKEKRTTPEIEQENKDSQKLGDWKKGLKCKGGGRCPNEVIEYLDKNLIGWRVQYDDKSMIFVKEIVQRGILREQNGGRKIPRDTKKNTPESEQEYKDAKKLGRLKQSLKGKKQLRCSDEIKDYLDKNLIGWRDEIDFEKEAINFAKKIVERGIIREQNGGRKIPRNIYKKIRTTPEFEEENRDATKLNNWKTALKGKNDQNCTDEVRDYLDENLVGWRDEHEEDAINFAKAIVERGLLREQCGGRKLPTQIREKEKRTTPGLEQENKDANKLGQWRLALKGKNNSLCTKSVQKYLDENLEGWRNEINLEVEAMKFAINIVQRGILREQNGGKKLPIKKEPHLITTPEMEQENKDSVKLGSWKQSLKGKKTICPESVRNYLDINLEGWSYDLEKKAINFAQEIVQRSLLREQTEGRKIPRQICDKNRTTPELEQEHKDAIKLDNWKSALKEKGKGICSDEVQEYLDQNLQGWRKEEQQTSTKSMELKSTTKEPNNKKKKAPQPLPEISQLHQKYKTLNSNNLHTLFKENPQLFEEYHTLSENNEKTFPIEEIPRNRIIAELDTIKAKRIIKIADLGCGKAHIAQHFDKDPRFQFHNYDHVSTKSTIESCDISTLPLEDNTIEICILCLAMWGSNCTDYLREAKRVLETNGRLYIVEATKRWTDDETLPADRLRKAVEDAGFSIRKSDIKKFTMFVCE